MRVSKLLLKIPSLFLPKEKEHSRTHFYKMLNSCIFFNPQISSNILYLNIMTKLHI